MSTTQDILQFHFSPTILKQSGHKIIPIALSSLNEHRIDKLQKIEDKLGASSFTFTGDNLIPQVFRKFKSFIKNNNVTGFDRRELRTLTYTLSYSESPLKSIFTSENELNEALILLNSNWRDSFLVGLIDCFLKNWETRYNKSLERLEEFILNRLDSYTGSRSALISFKNHRRYFKINNGDVILGDEVARLNKHIKEAPKILSVPDSWLTYPYFSQVIVAYYHRSKDQIIDTIDNLNEVLLQHNNLTTNKRLISKIIIQANQPQFSTLQEKVKNIAFRQIGDPGNIANWIAFENATEIEKMELIKARNILNEWITREFINVFFNVCINDERRKKFWLKYSSKINSFKVYGPLHTKNMLKRDQRIAGYVDARFETVNSKKDISAFILYIGDYMLIEFSDEGYAFYGYKLNGNYKPNLNYKLNSVDELRNGILPMLVYRSGYSINETNQEGRLSHNDGDLRWEQVFEYWLKNTARIDV